MPGEGGAAGRGGGAIGATAGLAATGAGAAGFGAAGFGAAMGLAATAGLRAGALRAAGFRAGALRAEVFFAVVLRAVARFAAVLRAGAFFLAAPVLRAVLRTARAVARPVLRAVRAAFLTVLRGLAFLVVLRFFPLVFVAMASAPICSVTALDRSNGPSLHDSRFTGPGLPSHQASQLFFSLYDDRQRKWQFGCPSRANINNEAFPRPSQTQARARRMSSIAMRWRKSGSTNRALTRPSVPITSVAGMGNIHPP